MEYKYDSGKSRHFVIEIVFVILCLSTCMADAGETAYPTRIALTCENSDMHIECTNGIIRIERANYGRFTTTICNPRGDITLSVGCGMRDESKTIVAQRCDGREHCQISATDQFFGDPCPTIPKYLVVEYECEFALFQMGKTLNCRKGCDGRTHCRIRANNKEFGKDPCPNTMKYLEVGYYCEPATTKAPTTTSTTTTTATTRLRSATSPPSTRTTSNMAKTKLRPVSTQSSTRTTSNMAKTKPRPVSTQPSTRPTPNMAKTTAVNIPTRNSKANTSNSNEPSPTSPEFTDSSQPEQKKITDLKSNPPRPTSPTQTTRTTPTESRKSTKVTSTLSSAKQRPTMYPAKRRHSNIPKSTSNPTTLKTMVSSVILTSAKPRIIKVATLTPAKPRESADIESDLGPSKPRQTSTQKDKSDNVKPKQTTSATIAASSSTQQRHSSNQKGSLKSTKTPVTTTAQPTTPSTTSSSTHTTPDLLVTTEEVLSSTISEITTQNEREEVATRSPSTQRPSSKATTTSTNVVSTTKSTSPTPSRRTSRPDTSTTTTTKKPRTLPVRKFCEGTGSNGVWWTPIEAGNLATRPCPEGFSGTMSWRCGGNGWIGSPAMTNCVSDWVNIIDDMLYADTNSNPIGVAEILESETSKKNMSSGDLKKTTEKIFPKLTSDIKKQIMMAPSSEKKDIVQRFSSCIVKTGSNLLSEKQSNSWKELSGSDRSKVATDLVVNMENAGHELATNLEINEKLSVDDENMLMELSVISTESGGEDEIEFPSRTSHKYDSWTESTDKFSLPKQSLTNVAENGVVRIVFLMYNSLGDWMNPVDQQSTSDSRSYDSQQPKDVQVAMETDKKPLVNTKIFSASVNNRRTQINLAEPMTYTLTHNIELKHLGSIPVCSYWNISQNGDGGQWSSSGCKVVWFDKTHTTCQCNHLTNFAVLMDVTGTKLSAEHRLSLTAITYVGCIISIICLICSLFTFAFFKNLQCDRNTIHKNLVFCLMLAETVFLIGIGLTGNRILCGIIAGVLHFLFLAAFGWMLLEGVQLYVMLIEVFEAERSRRKWYYLSGYGIPVVIVAVSAGIRHEGYGTATHCWLSTANGLIWSFVGPVIAVIIVNIIMLSIAVYMMCKHANTLASALRTKEKTRLQKISQDPSSSSSNGSSSTGSPSRTKSEILAWIKGAIVLVVLLGLTWAFGILYLSEESVIMAYIFTILNTLQGLFIFVFHCVMNEKVKKEYKKLAYRTTWLPSCLRNICVGYSGSMSHTPNDSDSSGGYLLKFWSKHKRKSSTSTYDRSSSNPKGKRRSDLESFSSNDTNSALFSRSASNRYSNNSKINGHSNGHLKMKPNDGIVGDLSVADCSVIDSEFVSEYCHNHLQVSLEKRRYSSGSEDEGIEESIGNNRLSVLSEDSATKHPSDFVPSDVDGEDGGYLEPHPPKKFNDKVVRQLSEYENAPLMPKTESEKNLLNDLLNHYQGQGRKQYPSMSDIYNVETDTNNINQSTPNIKYKTDSAADGQFDDSSTKLLQSGDNVKGQSSSSQEDKYDKYGINRSNGYQLEGYTFSDSVDI